MASIFRPMITRWFLAGKRVPAGTPGATQRWVAVLLQQWNDPAYSFVEVIDYAKLSPKSHKRGVNFCNVMQCMFLRVMF